MENPRLLCSNTKTILHNFRIIPYECSSILLQREQIGCIEIIAGFSSLFTEKKYFLFSKCKS